MSAPGTPLPSDVYVPILKAKMAEYGAIESCTSDRIVPLLEVIAPPVAEIAIPRAWPRKDHVIWLHSLNFDDVDEATFAASIESLFAALRPTSAAVPVITVTEGPDTLASVARIMKVDGRGVVLRVEAEDVLDAAANTAADIQATLDELRTNPTETDLVLDCGFVEGSASVRAAIADQCLQKLPNVNDWRTVVVAFSAFPAAVADFVPTSSVRALPRTDAAAFVLTHAGASRRLVFADYTIGVPTYASVPFAPIPNIRYASDDSWIVHRAKERKDPSTQYRALARDLVAAPYYSGPTFSPGDKQIEDVATGASGPGNAMSHLRAGISRHVHVVLVRLATLGEP
mgnify:FL=1